VEILEIEIKTDDLLGTETFYSSIFGLKLVSKSQNSISFLAGKSTLTFVKSNKLNPKYHFAFNIPNNKLDEAIIWATAKFNLIENDENGIVANFENWNARAIYFYDNNNNILEFIARFDLNNSTNTHFDISSILSISEIGIVADEPLQLANNLMESNNLDFFEKSNKSETFVALGNENGLIIIVQKKRKWYPTEQEAEKYFVRIKILVEGLTSEIKLNEENAYR
jgi:catechol-2,3-dioxygenase